ncbi:hypothetical protein LEP1GSC168_0837 [Leptospira santarosai str. HAI134]|nr:hypothetical protein LEP1GSC168_0837 [Leptospira santarosai str. HAI134]
MRQDILSLSLQELEILTSKGTVNRALKDIESGIKSEWKETENGNIEVVWEDSVVCVLPESVSIQEADCTCLSTGVCRHIVRTVVAYQKRTADYKPDVTWNPGNVTDENFDLYNGFLFCQSQIHFRFGVVVELAGRASRSLKYTVSERFTFPCRTIFDTLEPIVKEL